MGLLIFVVGVGLPIVGVPYLRHRLSARVLTLKAAMAGDIKPATLEVGANHKPFPSEFERPEPEIPRPPVLPQPKSIYSMRPAAPRSTPGAPGLKNFQVLPPPAKSEETTDRAAAQPDQSEEPQLKYQKGKAEQDAYDLLLKSNPTVAGMVQGSNPSLKFKSWDAANRGEDSYWVRLKFQSEGNPEEEYIWVVKLQSKEVTPLSHNARSIS